jgi:hypothetical protein
LAELRDAPHLESNALPALPQDTTNTFVYVRGSRDFFTWIFDIREKRRRGGQASAKRPRDNKGRLLKKAQHKSSTRPSKPSTIQVSGSGSDLGSGSGELRDFPSGNSAIALATGKTPALRQEKYNPVQIWCQLYKLYLGNSPELLKEDVGKLTNFAKGRSEEKCRLLFSCFFQIQKPYYQQRGYSVGTFFSDLQTINNAAESGVDPSQPQKFDVASLKD